MSCWTTWRWPCAPPNPELAPRTVEHVLKLLQALDGICLASLRPMLAGCSRLIFVPQGLLHYVPFHALYDGRRHLIEDFEVWYLPSADLLHRRERKADSVGTMLAVGHSHGDCSGYYRGSARGRRDVRWDSLLESEATVRGNRARTTKPAAAHRRAWGVLADRPIVLWHQAEDGWLKTIDIFSHWNCRLRW